MASKDWMAGAIFPFRSEGRIRHLKAARAAMISIFVGSKKSETNTTDGQ